MLKNFSASANSKILFIKVEEFIEIFLPIFHFGCLRASLGLIFLNFFKFKFRKGPPEAVRYILLISFFFDFQEV